MQIHFIHYKMCLFFPCVGNPTIPQGQRPSFMDYFDKQDSNKAQESYNHNQQDPYHMPKTAFPDNWKVPQDGDFDFVSRSKVMMCVWSSFVVLYFIVVLYFVARCGLNTFGCRLYCLKTKLVFVSYFKWSGTVRAFCKQNVNRLLLFRPVC